MTDHVALALLASQSFTATSMTSLLMFVRTLQKAFVLNKLAEEWKQTSVIFQKKKGILPFSDNNEMSAISKLSQCKLKMKLPARILFYIWFFFFFVKPHLKQTEWGKTQQSTTSTLTIVSVITQLSQVFHIQTTPAWFGLCLCSDSILNFWEVALFPLILKDFVNVSLLFIYKHQKRIWFLLVRMHPV